MLYTLYWSTLLSTMNPDAIFTTASPQLTSAITHEPGTPRARVSTPEREQELDVVGEEGGQPPKSEGWVMEFQVLGEGGKDVASFLDAPSWRNRLVTEDPTTRQARTNPMHNDRLTTIVSRWLSPPRTSRGGSRTEGRKQVMFPFAIDTVIDNEMNLVVEQLKEESWNTTERNVLGMVIEGKVRTQHRCCMAT